MIFHHFGWFLLNFVEFQGNFGDFLKIMEFCDDSTEKIRSELKNPFPTFFNDLSGKLIPRV